MNEQETQVCVICGEPAVWETAGDPDETLCDRCADCEEDDEEGSLLNTRHQHRCLVCFEKWDCLQDCDLSRGHHVEECTSCYRSRTKRSEELKHELDRFAAFIAAIRDLLRWLRIASNLKLMASGLRDSVGDVLGAYGCSCECTLYGGEREHNDDCDGNCTPCEGCAVQRVLNEYYEAQRKLQREGELIEKGFV